MLKNNNVKAIPQLNSAPISLDRVKIAFMFNFMVFWIFVVWICYIRV